jgi:site-specific DNA-adenine methylase
MGSKSKRTAKRGIAKPFSSPGGKEAWRGLILQRIPEHDIYVEPYAGSATIFFAKSERAETEILADVNPDIVATYVFLRDASDDDFEWMRQQSFESDPRLFKTLKSSDPATLRERVYRFKYLNLHSIRGAGDRYNGSKRAREGHNGKSFLRSLEKFRERLEGVKIFEMDALEVMKRFDSERTFFYLDPPWKPVGVGAEWQNFDADAFKASTLALKGKALISFQGVLDMPEPWKKVTIASALGGVGTMSEQTLLINFEPPEVAKSMRHMEGEGGTHYHDISREDQITGRNVWVAETDDYAFKPGEPEGPHSHLFLLPNGMVVATEHDGSHAHRLAASDANETEVDGAHQHSIPTANGPLQTTDEGSAHSHPVGLTSAGWGTGLHTHTVEVDGQTITSLTPGEFWRLFGSEQDDEDDAASPPANEPVAASKHRTLIQKPFAGFETFDECVTSIMDSQGVDEDAARAICGDLQAEAEADKGKKPKKPYQKSVDLYPQNLAPADAMVHQHFDGSAHWIAVRMRFDDRAIGWRLSTQRTPVGTADQASVAKRTSPHGDRYSKAVIGSRVLALQGAPQKGNAHRLDVLKVEFGLQSPHFREYFLSKGKSFSGVLRFEVQTDDQGRDSWTASLSKTALPRVLTDAAMLDGVMPPDGVPAIPESLAKMIAPEFRFWEFRGETAKNARDALVKSQAIREVALVDGEFRAVATKRFVLPYPEHPKVDVKKAAVPPDDLDRAKAMISWGDVAPVVIGPNMANEVGPDDLVEKLRATDREFLIGWPDSAHARRVFGELGRPFVVKHASERLVFVASRPVAKSESVAFVQTFDLDAEVAAILNVPAESATAKRIAKLYDDLLTREIPIYLTKKADGDAREEMFVYGIVLEPDTVDAQNDTYSADEIRKAAHGYMEFHRNRGDQHKTLVNDKVVILESHIERAPDFTMVDSHGNERLVKQGSWLLGYGIRDPELWGMVKRGERTGFSIGGSAVRRPRND